MAIKKVKKAKRPVRKPAKREITVSMTVFGNQKVSVKLSAGDSIGDLLAEMPTGWQVSTMTAMVNEAEVDNEHLLNDGDVVSFIPKVTGG